MEGHPEEVVRVGQVADSPYQALPAKTDQTVFAWNSIIYISTQANVLQVQSPKKTHLLGSKKIPVTCQLKVNVN